MRVPRVYASEPIRHDAEHRLDERASGHLVRVLRLKSGARLRLFDGRGGEYEAVLRRPDRRAAAVVIEDFHPSEPPARRLHLLQGLSRGERMDYTLQKAVELGVTHLTPVECLRSVAKLSPERAERRLAHWRGVVIAACEQSGRCELPVLDPVEGFQEAIEAAAPGLRLILEVAGGARLAALEGPAPEAAITLVAGPEGGFDPREREAAQAAGFQALRLGPRVLRTETAALAAIAALQALWGDLG